MLAGRFLVVLSKKSKSKMSNRQLLSSVDIFLLQHDTENLSYYNKRYFIHSLIDLVYFFTMMFALYNAQEPLDVEVYSVKGTTHGDINVNG